MKKKMKSLAKKKCRKYIWLDDDGCLWFYCAGDEFNTGAWSIYWPEFDGWAKGEWYDDGKWEEGPYKRVAKNPNYAP